MTPFMRRVVALFDEDRETPVNAPATRPSTFKPASVGADDQVAVRSLAEQLVCEANAVLTGDASISLTDDVVDGRLGFTLAYRTRSARVETRFLEGRSLARLSGSENAPEDPREIDSAEEVESVILLLLGDPGTSDFPPLPLRSSEPETS